jgi:hypothetical protein
MTGGLENVAVDIGILIKSLISAIFSYNSIVSLLH